MLQIYSWSSPANTKEVSCCAKVTGWFIRKTEIHIKILHLIFCSGIWRDGGKIDNPSKGEMGREMSNIDTWSRIYVLLMNKLDKDAKCIAPKLMARTSKSYRILKSKTWRQVILQAHFIKEVIGACWSFIALRDRSVIGCSLDCRLQCRVFRPPISPWCAFSPVP